MQTYLYIEEIICYEVDWLVNCSVFYDVPQWYLQSISKVWAQIENSLKICSTLIMPINNPYIIITSTENMSL